MCLYSSGFFAKEIDRTKLARNSFHVYEKKPQCNCKLFKLSCTKHCCPRHGDQFGNMRYVCDVWKVGTELVGEQLERGQVKAAIDRLFGTKEGEEIKERMKEFKIAAAKGIGIGVDVDETASPRTDLTDLVDLIKSF